MSAADPAGSWVEAVQRTPSADGEWQGRREEMAREMDAAVADQRAAVRERVQVSVPSDPVLGPPTAFSPWSATLCWSPEQNFGRVSLLTGRTSLGTVWGRLEAGESPEEVAKDFGLQVSAVHVVDQLRRELSDRRADPSSDEFGHYGDGRGVRLAREYIDRRGQQAAPGANLVRAEHVSGVDVANTDNRWKHRLPSSRPERVLGDRSGDVLSPEQRQRSAAAHEAGRMILAEDPSPEDIVVLADYIVTGRRPPAAVKVLPDESLIEQVVQRVAAAAGRFDLSGSDAATWSPRGIDEPLPDWEQELLDKQGPTP